MHVNIHAKAGIITVNTAKNTAKTRGLCMLWGRFRHFVTSGVYPIINGGTDSHFAILHLYTNKNFCQ